ncbi:MAG: hypothetical protein HGA63_03920 [Syntrophobacteraceae bacterium]|nr:hypothetical protein [Syntrophobacteraceae bacterium]
MRLPKFEYAEPKSIEEASSILSKEDGAKILAGGTDLLVNMKHRVETPAVIMSLKKIPDLSFVRPEDGGIRIGAMTSLKSVYSHPTIAEKLPGLALAASSVGSYHHQVMGTIGGNLCQQNRCKYFNQSRWWRSSRALCFKAGGELCHVVKKKNICFSSYCGDVAPSLLVMNAKALLESKEGKREVEVESLFTRDGKSPLGLRRGEILTEIRVPRESQEGFSTYMKFANRESIDFPIVGASLWASPDTKTVRLAFTAVDRKPLRARKAEERLSGGLQKSALEEAARLVLEEAKPVNTSLYPASHKRDVMGLLLESMITKLLGR